MGPRPAEGSPSMPLLAMLLLDVLLLAMRLPPGGVPTGVAGLAARGSPSRRMQHVKRGCGMPAVICPWRCVYFGTLGSCIWCRMHGVVCTVPSGHPAHPPFQPVHPPPLEVIGTPAAPRGRDHRTQHLAHATASGTRHGILHPPRHLATSGPTTQRQDHRPHHVTGCRWSMCHLTPFFRGTRIAAIGEGGTPCADLDVSASGIGPPSQSTWGLPWSSLPTASGYGWTPWRLFCLQRLPLPPAAAPAVSSVVMHVRGWRCVQSATRNTSAFPCHARSVRHWASC
eukprot:TRINITY_DN47469_c0_g1_i1.p1 TRINITY_DN47469_c0_g1~~TRINITY_DN47469_c0_g1_i1.p1  ORF type:complete len:283 (-),score=11.87 TRINITY_DN47469_c0_g1_i1:781-1629(-)